MFKFLENSYCGFKDRDINHQFQLWRYEHSQKQIQYILALTGILYITMGITNFFIFTSDIHHVLVLSQLLLIPAYAFLIAYLAYKKRTFNIVESLLFLAPILTAFLHAFIFSHLDSYSSYQTELYLMIFWTLTISGLRLDKAIFASAIVFCIGEIYPSLYYEDQQTAFIQHTMWMLISMLFGIVGGFLLHQSKKNTFEKEMELNKLATTDTLTGLYNRAMSDSILAQELNRAKRYNKNIGILILDIDHFKNVNDMYGHLVGDEILIAIAKQLQNSIRSSDYIFRWGGEEFIILCLEINKTDLITFAQEIREQVSQQEFARVGHKTLSIGATLSSNHDTIVSLMQRADDALYEAKEKGRNMVCYK